MSIRTTAHTRVAAPPLPAVGAAPSSDGKSRQNVVRAWWHRLTGLRAYSPRPKDARFWIVQGIALAVAVLHYLIESKRVLDYVSTSPGRDRSLFFVPTALFLVPVVYASLSFGSRGALPTTAWCLLLATPNVLLFHQGAERIGELVQLSIVAAVAVFAGQRVDAEMGARQRAEHASVALRASETRYRGLFESSPAAILVIDTRGVVVEANPATGKLFGRPQARLRGLAVADLVGQRCADTLLAASANRRRNDCLALSLRDGVEVYLEPLFTRINRNGREPLIQVLFRDVTTERHRQAGLKAYVASILHAQEEERERIAQELHDQTVQQLILLCQQLDLVESTGGPWSTAALAALANARQSAEVIVDGLRDFARALRPPMLDDLGLVACLRGALDDLSERTRIEGSFNVRGVERRLPPDAELGLFRIAQEALRNVERHAHARTVSVTLTFLPEGVRLGVVDDGMGFAAPSGGEFPPAGHLGLLGMRERAESFGANLSIQSTPGHGTRVTVSTVESAVNAAATEPGVAALLASSLSPPPR